MGKSSGKRLIFRSVSCGKIRARPAEPGGCGGECACVGSDRVCVLSPGKITAEGAASEFQGDLHQQVQQWLGLHF